MSIYGTDIGPVSFNPANRRFEALVSLREGADTVRIPTSLPLPMDTDASTVMRALIRQAKERRRMNRVRLTSKLRSPATEDIARLASDMDLVDVAKPSGRAFRRGHAPIAIAAMVGIVVLAGLGVAPILALSVVAVAVVLLTGAIDSDEAFQQVDGHLLALIFAMLAIGAALDHTGAVELIANALAPTIESLPPFLIIWSIYLMTSILTELVSNNAVAVVMTPIGYQTNMLVYGPGGYRFTDFMKIGIPLNLTMGLIVSAVIPLIWGI